jgi:hypothetical protein
MAGEFTFTVKRTVTGFGKSNGTVEQTVKCDGGTPISKTIPANSTNAHFVCPIDISATKVLSIETSQACTIYVNAASGSSPDQTLTMVANLAKTWVTGDDAGIFLDQDVTDLYITTGGSATNLSIIEGHDATPVLGDS